MPKLTDIMYEYGQACRGDWNNLDGKDVLGVMETFAINVDAGNIVLTDGDAKYLRTNLGLCPNGCGHWAFECEEEGCDSEE